MIDHVSEAVWRRRVVRECGETFSVGHVDRRGPDGECFKNAYTKSLELWGHASYAEGFAGFRGWPLLHHAWLVDRAGAVIEVTWKGLADCYVGITFDWEFVSRCNRGGDDGFGLLFEQHRETVDDLLGGSAGLGAAKAGARDVLLYAASLPTSRERAVERQGRLHFIERAVAAGLCWDVTPRPARPALPRACSSRARQSVATRRCPARRDRGSPREDEGDEPGDEQLTAEHERLDPDWRGAVARDDEREARR